MSIHPMPIPPFKERALRWSIRPVTTHWDRRHFLHFPAQLYHDDRYWVPPLFGERFDILQSAVDPAFVHMEVGLLMAEATSAIGGDQVVGTIAVLIDRRYNAAHRRNVGFFGLFETINNQEVADDLLAAAEAWLQEHLPDATGLCGPVRLGAVDGCGILADGFNMRPMVFMPYNPPYYAELIENAGFRATAELASYAQDLAPILGEGGVNAVAARETDAGAELEGVTPPAGRGLVLRRADPSRVAEEMRHLTQIYNRVLADRPGFMALADAGLERLVAGLAHYVDPTLLFFLEENDHAVGFCLAIPDLNAPRYAARRWPFPLDRAASALLRQRIGGARIFPPALLPEYRTPENAALLLSTVATTAARKGYRYAEYACISRDDPLPAGVLAQLDVRRVRTFKLYEKQL